MTEWQSEGVHVTKHIEVEGKWGDCPLPLLAECKLIVSNWNGPSSPLSQINCKTEGIFTYITGFATCLQDRMLEYVLCSMLEGEQALITLDAPHIQVRIELESFKNSAPIPDWSADKCIEVASKLKQKGVEIFQQSHSRDAFFLFSKALCVLTLGEGVDTKLSSTLSCNMAACQLQAGNPKYASELCDATLQLQPDNRKALYRKGMAAFNIGEHKVAENYASKVLKLEPSNTQAINLLASAREHLNNRNAEYQAVVQKMFSS